MPVWMDYLRLMEDGRKHLSALDRDLAKKNYLNIHQKRRKK